MSAPLRRNRDPQPVGRGWEVAFVIVAVVLGLVVLAALVGVGVSAAWWGAGWVWPSTAADVGTAVGGVLSGQPDEGYSTSSAGLLAPPVATYAAIAVSEAAHAAVALLLAVSVHRRLGPRGGRRGMATRSEAERALGVAHLRGVRFVIRPDLHRR